MIVYYETSVEICERNTPGGIFNVNLVPGTKITKLIFQLRNESTTFDKGLFFTTSNRTECIELSDYVCVDSYDRSKITVSFIDNPIVIEDSDIAFRINLNPKDKIHMEIISIMEK